MQKHCLCAERVAQLPAMLGLFGGEGRVANVLNQSVTAALSPLRAMPTLSSTEAWSFKQTAIAAQTFMLAATAHGE
jgi:nitroreductase